MSTQVYTAVVLAALLYMTPASAQISLMRAPSPTIAAAIEPASATPEQAFERLPETTRQALVALAAQEPLDGAGLSLASTQALDLLAIHEGDIEALSQMLLMLVARDADDDLHQIMAELSATERCSGERSTVVGAIAAPAAGGETGAPTIHRPVLGVARAREPVRVEQASAPQCASEDVSDLGQMRLQMVMDRRAKAQEMLSEALRNQSATAGRIIQNMQ